MLISHYQNALILKVLCGSKSEKDENCIHGIVEEGHLGK